ncbi:hypothetical protein DXG01_016012 [Tephrocybe rancida]|nr:hypothetical protein DXG01_016012 [Tephrocybe rancida]
MPSFHAILAFVVTAFVIASSAAPVALSLADITTLNNNKGEVGTLNNLVAPVTGKPSKRDLSPEQVTTLLAKGLSPKQILNIVTLGLLPRLIQNLYPEQIDALLTGAAGEASKHDISPDQVAALVNQGLSRQEIEDLVTQGLTSQEIEDFIDQGLSPEEMLAHAIGATKGASKRDLSPE